MHPATEELMAKVSLADIDRRLAEVEEEKRLLRRMRRLALDASVSQSPPVRQSEKTDRK